MSGDVWTVLRLTLLVAATATAAVLVPATLVGYLLARRDFPGKRLLSALVGLPLVLPPTAVGFLLLRLLAVDGPLGRDTLGFDLGLILTWKGAALAAGLMSLPLVARTARVTFEAVDPRLEQMARTLGYGRLETFARVTLPLAGRGLIAAVILGFTRAVGEFGATVTVAGNIPGRTQTLAAAIFSAQQVGDEARADLLMLLALGLGLAAILAAELLASGRGPGGGLR
ncbi:MAG: molybdate ABC transporter permease subunit [Acidobacteria bacterium]|nr:MAG: molybdate ABC transporter permease subunit [Acidobacteriota bacterium]